MDHPKIQAVYYAFCARGLTPALVSAHATFACEQLAARLGLEPAAINVVSKNKLPEDAEFQLTAYETNSSTTPPGTAFAAKIVLPHLRWAKRKSEECAEVWERVCDYARTGKKLPNGYCRHLAEVAQFVEAE